MKDKASKATPRPWHTDRMAHDLNYIEDTQHEYICKCSIESNAQMIVHRVNMHEELVSVLQHVLTGYKITGGISGTEIRLIENALSKCEEQE